MNLKESILEIMQQNLRISVMWDTRKDIYQCYLLDPKSKKTFKLNPDIFDHVIDLTIDKIVFGTEQQEYTSGMGKVYVEDDKIMFEYSCENKFLRCSEPEIIDLEFEHPEEVGKHLNRSRLNFYLSINHLGFIRQDIKPDIDEGDAYALGTHVFEKYRSYFQKILKSHYDIFPKLPYAIEYNLTLTSTISALHHKSFEKIVYWYEIRKEEKLVELPNVIK